jgi:hypothetical protein
MPQVGFEPTIAIFKEEKIVYASDRASTVIDKKTFHIRLISTISLVINYYEYSVLEVNTRRITYY